MRSLLFWRRCVLVEEANLRVHMTATPRPSFPLQRALCLKGCFAPEAAVPEGRLLTWYDPFAVPQLGGPRTLVSVDLARPGHATHPLRIDAHFNERRAIAHAGGGERLTLSISLSRSSFCRRPPAPRRGALATRALKIETFDYRHVATQRATIKTLVPDLFCQSDVKSPPRKIR